MKKKEDGYMKKISTSNAILVIIVIFQFVFAKLLGILNLKLSMPVALSVSQLTILVPFLGYCLLKKQNPLKVIRFKKTKPVSIFFAFLIALASYPVVIFLNMVSMLFVENAMTDVMPAVLEMGLLPGLCFMALMPAFVEETIFRGMLYNTYSKYRPVAGIILSAVLFGLMHMNFNQMPYAIYLGIIMALVMEACDSIIAPMIIHFTMNASSSIMVFLSQGVLETAEGTQNTDLKSALMESYTMTMEQMGMELSQAQLEAMFPAFIAGMVLVFAIIALVAFAIVMILVYAVASINGRPLKEVLRKKESETKTRMIDVWVILFVIYTLYECIMSVGL